MKIKTLYIVIIFLVCSVVFTYPAVLNLDKKIIGDGTDSSLNLGWQYLAKLRVDEGRWPFGWTNYWRYPVGANFANGYDSAFFILLGLLLYIFTTNQIIVFNLSTLIIVFLNGILSYLFFKKVAGDKLLGIAGAIIYGYSFYLLSRLGGHMNLIFVGVFPFFLYSFIVFKERKVDNYGYWWIFISTALLFLSSIQYIVIAILAVILLLPIFIIFHPDRATEYYRLFTKKFIKTSLVLIGVIGTFLLFNHSRLSMYLTGELWTRDTAYMQSLSPFLAYFYLPSTYTNFLINGQPFLKPTGAEIEFTLYLGLIEMLLFVGFLFIKGGKFVPKAFIVTSFFLILTITLGCKSPLYPFCYLYNYIPFSGLPEPGRFYVILYLVFTYAVVVALKNIKKRSIVLFLLILLLISLERIPTNFHLSDTLGSEKFIEHVKGASTKAVFDLPIMDLYVNGKLKDDFNLYSTYYEKPIVQGIFHWNAITGESQSFLNNFRALECGSETTTVSNNSLQEIVELLKKYEINTIVFHKNIKWIFEGQEMCDQAINNINYFLENADVKLTYEDIDVAVFQLQ